jgi:hypothetical protein
VPVPMAIKSNFLVMFSSLTQRGYCPNSEFNPPLSRRARTFVLHLARFATAISLALSVCQALNAARTARVCRKHADCFWTNSSDARKSQEAPMSERIAADTMFLE